MVNKTNVLSIEILKPTFLVKIMFNEAKGKIEQVFFTEIFISEFYKNSTKKLSLYAITVKCLFSENVIS